MELLGGSAGHVLPVDEDGGLEKDVHSLCTCPEKLSTTRHDKPKLAIDICMMHEPEVPLDKPWCSPPSSSSQTCGHQMGANVRPAVLPSS